MGLLDGVSRGVVGVEITSLVSGVIERNGGLSGLASKFEQQGLAGIMQSWIGTGTNQPVSADQIHQVLGSNALAQEAKKWGIEPRELAQKLAQALPQAVDKMTPDGFVERAQ